MFFYRGETPYLDGAKVHYFTVQNSQAFGHTPNGANVKQINRLLHFLQCCGACFFGRGKCVGDSEGLRGIHKALMACQKTALRRTCQVPVAE